jgi:hypothetical protein
LIALDDFGLKQSTNGKKTESFLTVRTGILSKVHGTSAESLLNKKRTAAG